MNRYLATACAILFLASCDDAAPTATRQTSDGGLAYTLISLPGSDDISIQIAWGSDWGYRAETNKAAPYVGADLILAGGAAGFAAGEAAEQFADLGSEGIIYVSLADHVIGELTFYSTHLDETVAIANAHLHAPTLDQDWFERISFGLAQDMAEASAQPAHASYDAVRWAVLGDQPLRNALSLDDPDTFATLTRDDVVAWHKETFTRTPEAVVIAGDISPETAGAALDALLAGLPVADRVLSRDAVADFTPRRILLHLPATEVTALSFIAPLPPTRHGKEFEDMILGHALGGDDQSVLFSALRTDLRATYGFPAGIANYTRDQRFLFMTGEVETSKLAEAETVVRAAYAAFLTDGAQRSLEDYKSIFSTNLADLPDRVARQARSELQSLLDGYPPGRSLGLLDELEAVTQDSIAARLTTAFPAPEALVVMAVSPDAAALPDACVIALPQEAAACR